MLIQARKRIVNTLDLIMAARRRCSQGNQEDEKVGSDDAFMLTGTEIKDNILTMIIAGQKIAYTQICCCTVSF
jgi:cytochrome P450